MGTCKLILQAKGSGISTEPKQWLTLNFESWIFCVFRSKFSYKTSKSKVYNWIDFLWMNRSMSQIFVVQEIDYLIRHNPYCYIGH